MFYRIFVVASIFLLFITACGEDKSGQRCLSASSGCLDDSQIPVEPQYLGDFRCDAAASPNIVNANEVLALNISATGGAAPYSVPAAGIPSFGGTTTVYGSYYNNTGSDRVVSRTLTVYDAVGNATTCSFSVTVKSSTNTSGLYCSIDLDPANPKQNQQVDFTITASGGTGTYEFSDLYLQSDWHVAPTIESNGVAKAAVIYRTPGTRTASIRVSNNGKVATCAETVNVSEVAIKLAASPRSRVNATDTITLQATLNGFSTTSIKTFTFQTDETGVDLVQDSIDPSKATVKANDGKFHAFKVKASVTTSENEVATPAEINLVIGEDLKQGCFLVARPQGSTTVDRTYSVNAPVQFTIECLNVVGEPAILKKIVDIDPGFGAYVPIQTLVYDPTRAVYAYSSEGIRRVSAKSEDGFWVHNVIEIRNSIVGCSVVTNPNPSILGGRVVIQTRLVVPIDYGSYDVEVRFEKLVNNSWTSTLPSDVSILPQGDVLNKPVTFNVATSFLVKASVTDRLTNKLVNCSSTHVVNSVPGLLASAYRIPKYQRDHRFRLGNADWSYLDHINNFTASNINVSDRYYKDGFPQVCLSGRDSTWFVIRYQGFINIPDLSTLEYENIEFKIMSDDGAILKIDDLEVLNRDGLHSPSASPSCVVPLKAQPHPITVEYFQGPAVRLGLQLYWKHAGTAGTWQIVPPSAFSH